MTRRDRALGAVFVLIVAIAQFQWMGPAVALLSAGLILAGILWMTTRWNSNPAEILPMYLLAIVVQCLHFSEEYLTGFQYQFPKLLGYEWSDARFLAFNMIWLAVFTLAAVGVYLRVSPSYIVVMFLALGGGVLNGLGHLLLGLRRGGYFPGLATAPLCLLAGIAVLVKLFERKPTLAAGILTDGPKSDQHGRI